MSETNKKTSNNILVYILLVIVIALVSGLGYAIWLNIEHQNAVAERDLLLTDLDAKRTTLETEIANLKNTLASATSTNERLARDLEEAEDDLDDLEDEIGDALGIVTSLSKREAVDEELIQKYSKVSFLNEHYQPARLREIDDRWTLNPDRKYYFHRDVLEHLEDMLARAKKADHDIQVVSAYRSFDTQEDLKSHYLVTYGSGANAFSADQGFSEHQLGTAVDFTTDSLGVGYTSFGQTEAYEWMLDNAHKYGFILSYPEGNQYYQYEPWHWRFVGRDLADYLHDEGLNFYDVDQRDIDEYRESFFD